MVRPAANSRENQNLTFYLQKDELVNYCNPYYTEACTAALTALMRTGQLHHVISVWAISK